MSERDAPGGPYRTAAKQVELEPTDPGGLCSACNAFVTRRSQLHRIAIIVAGFRGDALESDDPAEVVFQMDGLCIGCLVSFREGVRAIAIAERDRLCRGKR